MSELPSNKEYKFKTFQEAYETVPADKLETCFQQLGKAMALSKGLDELRIEVAKSLGLENETYAKLPEYLGWIDDNECNIEVRIGDLRATISKEAPSVPSE